MRHADEPALRLSVIVTTYNHPRALALVLAGLERQSVRSFELLIADDGSGPETRALVDAHAQKVDRPVRHVWHPDDGFRKCTILNRAIREATGDYLVFFDGDCIPRRDCLAIHLRSARRDRYLAGGKIPLDQALTDRLTPREIEAGLLDRIGPWWRHAGKRRRLLVSRLPLVRSLLDRRHRREPAWRGENSSAFADHIREVGGFDERFSYGFEDADFGHRLQAFGLHGWSIRYTCPVIHLEHARPWSNPEVIAQNREIYDENRAAGLVRTPHGLTDEG